jgi:hypothetical protein
MAPISGAEGYAGALFEAYAIRRLQSGGSFTLRLLGTSTDKVLDLVSISDKAPIVIQGNILNETLVPIEDVRIRSGSEKWIPCLLWPTTTNFPTFDCFYFDTDGQIYCLQMTIAAKHDLKKSGASNAKKYMDKIYEEDKNKNKPAKYHAVFVVRKGDAASYQPQKFTGKVGNAAADSGGSYEQWVLGV